MLIPMGADGFSLRIRATLVVNATPRGRVDMGFHTLPVEVHAGWPVACGAIGRIGPCFLLFSLFRNNTSAVGRERRISQKHFMLIFEA